MTQAWGPITLTAVAANGAATALFPNHVTAGAATTTAGSQRRAQREGVLFRLEVYSTSGGLFELWDLNGLVSETAGNNNVSLGTVITDAFITAAIAAGKARLIHTAEVTGTAGDRPQLIQNIIPFCKGLVARFSNAGPAGSATVNIVADGGFEKYEFGGL